jgi:eukaryotic-like serine/threonine-protein kinase
MIETGVIGEERSGTGRRLSVRRPVALRDYMRREFPDMRLYDAKLAVQMGAIMLPARQTPATAEASPKSRAADDVGPLVYISYAPEDDQLLREFEEHLAPLKRSRTIRAWHTRLVPAGANIRSEIERQLGAAQIVVILLSSSYLADDRLYEQEMRLALERAQEGLLVVVPVLARACDWKGDHLAGLQPLPRNEMPVKSWSDRDDAWVHVAAGLREVVEERSGGQKAGLGSRSHKPPKPVYENAEIRALAEQLDDAYRRRDVLREAGESTVDVDAHILEFRRRFREGGRLRAGDTLGDGRYLLLGLIGRGGFASVWRGLDRDLDERVAIKVLHPEQAGDPVRRERFFRGARVMATLGHEAVVRVLSQCAEDAGHFYFVMELAEGGDLQRAVVTRRVRPEQTAPLVLAVGDALAEAHAKGIVHRDVKPANIVLAASGAPRLTDFDLATMDNTTGGTRTGTPMGSYLFMAPEQGRNAKEADARADVYGLAMTALFCLHGGELPLSTMRQPEWVIAALAVDTAVKDVLTRAIALDRADRFADARAFCEALRAAVSRLRP